jgi:nitroreductase
MDSDKMLSTTRSVRLKLDLDRPVEHEVIDDCLRLALQAPTPANMQNWRWLVIRDQSVKNALGELFRAEGTAYIAEEAAGAPEHALRSSRHLIDVIERIPVLVVPCLLGRPPADNNPFDLSVFYGGIFQATWSFQLALRSRGLGSTFTTYHLRRASDAAKILRLPDDVTQTSLIPVAYTTVTEFQPSPRLPVSEVAYADHWGTPLP